MHLKLLIVLTKRFTNENLQMLCIQLKSDVSHMIVDRIYFCFLFPVVSGGKVGYNFSTIRFVLGLVLLGYFCAFCSTSNYSGIVNRSQ